MAIAEKMTSMKESSSFIRRMFETGTQMKAEFGAHNVFDFSIGNPSLLPPRQFTEILKEEAAREEQHSYMPNAGYPAVRDKVAEYVSQEQGIALTQNNIIMTSGAGGALNIALKALLNPGDTVIASKPCFMEYRFYCDNHGGELLLADCQEDFDLDVDKMTALADHRTAAIILNSPNNPSGRIYPEKTLKRLASRLEELFHLHGRRIYLICDEPYRKLVYDQVPVPSVMKIYPHTAIATSYSKDLSIPGERIGFLAIHPEAEDSQEWFDAAVMCNRILGYVNANALMQRVVARLQGEKADMESYQRKRDTLSAGLLACGFSLTPPEGTFYLFVKTPERWQDMDFIEALKEEKILAVPGAGFGLPGYFRLSFCVDDSTIKASLPAFQRVAKKTVSPA